MSKVSIQGDQNGTGDFTIKAPNSNSDRTLTIPDSDGEFLFTDSNGDLSVDGNTFYVDSVNNRVGVGTSSPDFELDVSGISRSQGEYLEIPNNVTKYQVGGSTNTSNFNGQQFGIFTFSDVTSSSTICQLTKSANGYLGGMFEVSASVFRTGSGGDGGYALFTYGKSSSSVGSFSVSRRLHYIQIGRFNITASADENNIFIKIDSNGGSALFGKIYVRAVGGHGFPSNSQGMSLV